MTKNKKTKNMNWKLILALVLGIVIIAGIVLIINSTSKNLNSEETNLGNSEYNVGLIDMTNKENAELVDGVKINTSEKISEDRVLEGIEIKEIKLYAKNGISNFTATVENNTSSDFEGGVAVIKFTNKDGSEYATLEVYVPEIKKGGTNSINAATTADIANAYDYTIELQK